MTSGTLSFCTRSNTFLLAQPTKLACQHNSSIKSNRLIFSDFKWNMSIFLVLCVVIFFYVPWKWNFLFQLLLSKFSWVTLPVRCQLGKYGSTLQHSPRKFHWTENFQIAGPLGYLMFWHVCFSICLPSQRSKNIWWNHFWSPLLNIWKSLLSMW